MTETLRPRVPNFSSGPCAKRPGWTPDALNGAALGRSHRSKLGKSKLKLAIDQTREILGVPDDYKIGIVAASDTGSVEMALWSLLGERPVDVLAWESFGKGWANDILKHLKLNDTQVFEAPYGEISKLADTNSNHDIVFAWNGTTSGVKVPNGDWISDDRKGLTICDATSAAFAMDLPWEKLDVITYSWQKVLGGEGQHGVLILSPRAVERLESYTPPWPLPKLFRLTNGGKLISGIFEGATINTPSMLCVEDYLDALNWAKSIGGLKGLISRSEANAIAIGSWIDKTPWVANLCDDEVLQSNTSVCLKIVDPSFKALDVDSQKGLVKKITTYLEVENAGFDLGAYRDAPPGFRLWAGATVETSDLEALFPWLNAAYQKFK